MAGRIYRKFPRTFWIANSMELLERWAWYGMFMVLALYLTGSTDTGALGFSQQQKGWLMGSVVAILYFLPLLTGAIADRFGYKRVLVISYIILASGYYLMGQVHSYALFYIVFLYLAIGAALFKPVISATISKTTDASTSSVGFGIFYMIVNIGAFIGPIVASRLRLISWDMVFTASAIIILLNMVMVLLFYREPARDARTNPIRKEFGIIFRNIWETLSYPRLLIFLLIIVGFWTMYNQLFYTLPVFIDQWVDTSTVYRALASLSPGLAAAVGTKEGTIAAEMMTNLDALYIVIFQVLVSTFVMRYKPLTAMVSGIFVSALGLGLTFLMQNGMFLFVTILIFGLGEMATSPKIFEYLGRVAPAGKTALYMGASYLPMAGGNFLAGLLSGDTYARMSDKVSIAQREASMRGLDIPAISDEFSSNQYLDELARQLDMDAAGLTQYLWQTHHPEQIWLVFTGIGLATGLALFLFDKLILKDKSMGSAEIHPEK